MNSRALGAKPISLLLGAVALLASSIALPTAGNAVTFDLTSDHCEGGCGTAPFGTVSVTQAGANVNLVVDLANGPPNTVSWAQVGDADFQLFKFNATGVAVGDISVTQTFLGNTLQANFGTFNGDGTGPFSLGISCTTCGNGNLGITSDLVFSIANATIAEVTAANNLGNIFVADVLDTTGNTGPVATPLPAALPLFASGLGALGLLTWPRKRKAAA